MSKEYNLIIGSHVSLKAKDFFLGSVKEAISYNANTFMVYTGAPQNTKRQPVEQFKIDEAFELLKANNIDPKNLVVHAPYIINPCSAKNETRKLAADFLIKEIERTAAMGIKYIVLHPGSALGQDLETATKQVAYALNNAFKLVDNDVVVCLETMSGKGSEIGINTAQLKMIIDQIENKDRIGVCLDTCHLHEGGIDLTPASFDQYLEDFDQQIGLEYIKVLHINDSKNPISSHKDRHENLGYGYISFDALIHILYHPKLNHLPKILETPWFDIDDQNSVPIYKYEIEMIKNKQWFDIKKQLTNNK
ncbi:endonuclease IV [Ureaplasma diversum]|uniref:Probable endonuclease 4 n=1 Tax=Ureaplasma diversum TaxID=42094 RepID=A0A0C5RC06_9BACT|nr:deoxyribonuclease IV [Ureaplasma diversum]AJQ45391.1 endonuclease IV [Ureaplasma diversum]